MITNMETLENKIVKDIMTAMKEKNEVKLSALRSVKTAIQNEKTNGSFHELTNADVVKIIQKQIKQRNESEEIYRQANRNELADKEMNERIVLEEYVPKVMTYDEHVEVINKLISELGATSMKEIGKVMGELNKRYVGQVDGKLASTIIKEKLS